MRNDILKMPYPDAMPIARIFAVVGLTAGLAGLARAEVTVTGQTSRPDFNVYIPGERIPLHFEVRGLEPGAEIPILRVRTVDEDFKVLRAQRLELTKTGEVWTATTEGLSGRLGFYRVLVSVSDGEGITLPKLGSRPAGFLTYCIVPDPAGRPQLGMREARFGMQGGFNGALNPLPYLGVRWVNGRFDWNGEEPEKSGQFAAKRAAEGAHGPAELGSTWGYDWCRVTRKGRSEPWAIYPVFSLYKPPDWAIVPGSRLGSAARLNDEGKVAWRAYCSEVAKAAVADYPELEERFYQITWEPNWFTGTPEEFVNIYRDAYEAIHAIDARAVVMGPTKAAVGAYSMEQEADWFKHGFGQYLDAYSIHPYTKMPPESSGYIEAIRKLKANVARWSGKELTFVGTEQGEATGEDVTKELAQATGLIRASIIALGEGFRFNFGFYITDYLGDEPGFGYFYNLRPDKRFGTDRIAPKPVAPAYAAETLFLDGHRTLGPIPGLRGTTMGYAFERGGKITLALWDYGAGSARLSLAVSGVPLEVYDWMGNRQILHPTGGRVQLTLGAKPIYVRGIAAKNWTPQQLKPQSPKPIVAARAKAPVKVRVLTPNISNGRDVSSYNLELENIAGRPVSGTMVAFIPGVAGSRAEAPFELAADGVLRLELASPEAIFFLQPGRRYPLVIQTWEKGGGTYSLTRSLGILRMESVSPSATIDGRLDDWAGIPELRLTGREWVTRSGGGSHRAGELSASLRLGWNKEAVYVAAEVRDDILVPVGRGPGADGLYVKFNLDPETPLVSTGNLYADKLSGPRQYQLFLGMRPDGRPFASDSRARVAVVHSGGKTIYEASIPWSGMGANDEPEGEGVVGVGAAIIDADSFQKRGRAVGIFGFDPGSPGGRELGIAVAAGRG